MMEVWWWLLIVLLVFLSSYYVIRKDMQYYSPGIPVIPWNLPWLGHLVVMMMNKKRLLEWFLEYAERYSGMPFYCTLPLTIRQPILVITDPESVKHVFLNNFPNYHFSDLRKSIGRKILGGNSIFMVDGKKWEILRDLAQPQFTINVRKQMASIFKDKGMMVASILRSTQTTIDFQELIKKMTIDAFSTIAFGIELGFFTKEVPFGDDLDWVVTELEEEAFHPIRKILHASEFNMRLKRMNQFIFDVIQKRKEDGWEGKLDIISILLKTEQEPEVIRDALVSFFLAGRDTTACLLTWTFYYLSTIPQVRAKVKEEIEEQLGNSSPDFENIKNLKYLRMVLDEVLRLHPPANPVNSRQAVNDDVLPNGAKVKAGQVVFISPYLTQRMEKYWGKDANVFCPERWKDTKASMNPYIFFPFQRGPRTCLGREMAYEEATIVTTVLIQKGIQLKVIPGQNLNYKYFTPVILSFIEGLKVTVLPE